MQMSKLSNPQNIMQVYRQANVEIDDVNDLEQIIQASQKVVSYCNNSSDCVNDVSHKKNQLLFWSYISMAKAHISQNEPNSGYKFSQKNYTVAMRYFEEALLLAVGNSSKIEVLHQIAELYSKLGREADYFKIKDEEISYLDDSLKRKAYFELEEKVEDENHKIALMEKALDFVALEDVAFLTKCNNVLVIGDYLEGIYRNREDMDNFERILKILDKTTTLMVEDLKERITLSQEHDKNLKFYAKVLDIETKYLEENTDLKKKTLQQLATFLKEKEEIEVNGIIYNKHNISELLH